MCNNSYILSEADMHQCGNCGWVDGQLGRWIKKEPTDEQRKLDKENEDS